MPLPGAGGSPSAARRPGETMPTCEETSFRRRLWNAPPRSTCTGLLPYQLISTMVASSPGAGDGGVEAGAGGAGMKHDVGVGRRVLRPGEPCAQSFHHRAAAVVRVHRGHRRARQPRGEGCDQQPHDAGAHHHDAVARRRRRCPTRR